MALRDPFALAARDVRIQEPTARQIFDALGRCHEAFGDVSDILRQWYGELEPLPGSRLLLHLQDQKSAGTSGGTFTAGSWQTRILNTEVTDEIGSTLSSNQFTLPAGTFYADIRCPAHRVDRHKAKLRNVTDGSDALIGTGAYCWSSDLTDSYSVVRGRFTLAAAKTLEVQHRCQTTHGTFGFGVESNFGVTEIYTDALIWRVA